MKVLANILLGRAPLFSRPYVEGGSERCRCLRWNVRGGCREHDERNSVQICHPSVDDPNLMQTPQDPKVVLCILFRACHSSDFLVNSDAAVVVENELLACCVKSNIVKDLVLLHSIQSLDHPSNKYHLNLLRAHVQNFTWASVRLFLESD